MIWYKQLSFGINRTICSYLIGSFQNFLEEILTHNFLDIEVGLKLFFVCSLEIVVGAFWKDGTCTLQLLLGPLCQYSTWTLQLFFRSPLKVRYLHIKFAVVPLKARYFNITIAVGGIFESKVKQSTTYTFEWLLGDQSKASRQFAQPSLLRLGEKKAKTKTTI